METHFGFLKDFSVRRAILPISDILASKLSPDVTKLVLALHSHYETSCPFAQNNLGWMYQHGVLYPKDIKKALEYYEKAANQGHVEAAFRLAKLLEDEPSSKELSQVWLRHAARADDAYKDGYPPAILALAGSEDNLKAQKDYHLLPPASSSPEDQYQLAIAFFKEQNEQKYDQAFYWCYLAFKNGHQTACSDLLGILACNKENNELVKKILNANNKQAQIATLDEAWGKLCEKLAKTGYPPAQYSQAERLAQDPSTRSRALALCRAASKHYPESYYLQGWCHDVQKEYGLAFTDYMNAAKQGYTQALYNLADMYAHGAGVVCNPSQVYFYYFSAALRGSLDAIDYLIKLFNAKWRLQTLFQTLKLEDISEQIKRDLQDLYHELTRAPSITIAQTKTQLMPSAVELPPPAIFHPINKPSISMSMLVLNGFIEVLGLSAVVLAFTLLNAASFGLAGLVCAGIGAAVMLTGIGIFASGAHKHPLPRPELSRESVPQPLI